MHSGWQLPTVTTLSLRLLVTQVGASDSDATGDMPRSRRRCQPLAESMMLVDSDCYVLVSVHTRRFMTRTLRVIPGRADPLLVVDRVHFKFNLSSKFSGRFLEN
jgi:hypothetical protein